MKNRIIEKLFSNGHGKEPGTAVADQPPVDWKAMKEGLSDVSSFVSEHPAACLGAAFATGIFLGWMVKRS